MTSYRDPSYWKFVAEQEEQLGPSIHPCTTEGCTRKTSSKGFYCIPCRREEAAQHQAKIDAYYEDFPPCEVCGSKMCSPMEH